MNRNHPNPHRYSHLTQPSPNPHLTLTLPSPYPHLTQPPHRAKIRGSGTEAMVDLVGFREENVLPIAAFYKSEVQINYLAELITDNSVPVKEAVVKMFGEFMTEMGDRYDHQVRSTRICSDTHTL